MNDKMKKSLDKVRAEEELKNRTKAFLYQKTKGYSKGRAKRVHYRHLVPAFACFLFIMLGGHWLYFTPTAEISIEISPSIELGVNRFDKIISVRAGNSDGQELAGSLNIKYLDYIEAVNQILMNENVSALLSNDEVMTIGVIGSHDAQSAEMLSQLESCTAGEANTYCYYANADEAGKARELGLSYAKYRAYLELQALGSAVTPDELQSMTMREIWDLIDSLSEPGSEEDSEGQSGRGGHGTGRGFGQGQRKGYGANRE